MIIEQHIRPVQANIVQLPVHFELFPQRRGQMIQHICAKAAVCVGRGHNSFLLLAVPAPAALFRLHWPKFYRFQYNRKFADLLPFCVCFL